MYFVDFIEKLGDLFGKLKKKCTFATLCSMVIFMLNSSFLVGF